MVPKLDKRRKDPDHNGYGGFKADQVQRSTQYLQKRHRLVITFPKLRLDYKRLISLPMEVISRVCRFLHPIDLITLARASKELRQYWMSKRSRPHWNATRLTTGMPNWPNVVGPQATAVIYEPGCQEAGCSAEGSLLALYVARRYCLNCASVNLLNFDEVTEQFPSIPGSLVKLLPWTIRRTLRRKHRGRFYLKSTLIKLRRRLEELAPLSEESLSNLCRELYGIQKQRQSSTAEVDRWQKGRWRRAKLRRHKRWQIVKDAMISRWGWKPVPYEKLCPRLKRIVNDLLNVSLLSESVWTIMRGDVAWTCAIQNRFRAKASPPGPRPFTLPISNEAK